MSNNFQSPNNLISDIIIEDATDQILWSEEVQDIISGNPSRIIKWGSLCFFSSIFCIIILSSFIKYPEVIRTRLKINSYDSPKVIKSKMDGKIISILVKEKEFVSINQPLAFLESTADHKQVLDFYNKLTEIRKTIYKGKHPEVDILNLYQTIDFGELQPAFQIFFHSLLEFYSAFKGGYYAKKKDHLHKELSGIVDQKKYLLERKELQREELEIAYQELQIHKHLVDEKAEAPLDYNREKSKVFSKKIPFLEIESNVISNNLNYYRKEQEIVDIDKEINERTLKFIQSLNTLMSEIESWKSKYVLTAPSKGRIYFNGIINQNQLLTLNQEVFYVSSEENMYYGLIALPQHNMGNIKIGQDVLIKLDSYPYENFGVSVGKITTISDLPYNDSIFISKVEINLKSNVNSKMKFSLKNGMTGSAEIVTKDFTVLERLLTTFIKVTN